ncbi:hypothetical protein OAA91_01495, partial [Fibrobacterales bacterium]|nr:hypothetical protein [Fibrobacterales bacterium]
KEDAPVLCSGVKCGRVISIKRINKKANILIGLHGGKVLYQELAPRVVTIGFVGQRALELGFYELENRTKTELEAGAMLKGEKPRGPASFGPSVAAFYEVFQVDMVILKEAYSKIDKEKLDTLLVVLSEDLPKSIKRANKIFKFSKSEVAETLANVNDLQSKVGELKIQFDSMKHKLNKSPLFGTLENIGLHLNEAEEKLDLLQANFDKSDLKKITTSPETKKEIEQALEHIQQIGIILKEQKVRLVVDFF